MGTCLLYLRGTYVGTPDAGYPDLLARGTCFFFKKNVRIGARAGWLYTYLIAVRARGVRAATALRAYCCSLLAFDVQEPEPRSLDAATTCRGYRPAGTVCGSSH
eukprot:SAG31_NODE_322_length_17726_cov_18.070006_4_plen_104_part_00